MKANKFLSVPVVLAAVLSAFVVFAVSAGAYQYKYPIQYDDNGTMVYGTLADYYNTTHTPPASPLSIVMPNTNASLNPDPYPSYNNLYTALSYDDLNVIKDHSIVVNFRIIDSVTNAEYRTGVSAANLTTIPSGGIDPALIINPKTGGDGPTFTIKSVASLGDVTLDYTITYSEWEKIKSHFNLPEHEDVYYQYLDENGVTVTKVIRANTDAKFSLTGTRTLTFTYDSSLKYYSKEETDQLIRDKLLNALGFTEAEIAATPVKDYIDQAVAALSSAVGSAGYVTEPEVNNIINNYYGEKDTSGNYTTAAKTHLTELATALIDNAGSKSAIDDEILDVFGLGTPGGIVKVIKEDVTNNVVKAIMDMLLGTDAPISSYKDAINFYYDQTTYTKIRSLYNDLKTLSETYQKPDSTYYTLTELIDELYKYKKQLAGEGTDAGTISDILKKINDITSSFTNGGKQYSIADILVEIEKAKTDAEGKARDYIDNKNYQEQINYLRSELSDLTYLLKQLQDKENYLESQVYYGTDNWIIKTYGSIDRFIAEVSDEVEKRLKISIGDGDSAYEVAVKNGYRGTEREWLNSLVGDSAYEVAVKNGFRGTEREWLESLKGADGRDGRNGTNGRDGEDGKIVYVYGDQPNSSNIVDYDDAEEPDPDTVDFIDATIVDTDDYIPSKVNGTGNDNNSVAGANASKNANPATGAAAGILIPAAAAASILLVKKDKRRRGRK